MRIDPIIRNLQEGAAGVAKPKDTGAAASGSFIEELKSKIGEVNQMQTKADLAVSESSINGASNIHETMIKLEEADMGMRFLAKVRNKALDAYHEVMRMQF
jgi:flagellar hook-basal body complex protein FliE